VSFPLAIAIGAILIELWILSQSSQLRNLFVLAHALLFMVLFNILHVITLLAGDSLPASVDSYFLTTSITVGYFAVFTNLPIPVSRLCVRTEEVLDWALRVSDRHILLVFLCWAVTKSYLVSKYGVSAFFVYRQLAGDERIVYREFLDATLETVTETLAIGGIVFFVIRLAIIRGYLKRLWVVLPAIAFLSVYLGLGESDLGTRRFLFVLAAIGVASLVHNSSGQFARVLRDRWKLLLLMALLVGGASLYYQAIRTNRDRQEIAENLLSPSYIDVGRGVIGALLPPISGEDEIEPAEFFREGPFDLLLTIVSSLTRVYKPIGGELTYSSVQMVIPRAILGEQKISVSVDEIIAEHFDIDTGPQILTIDLPKNLLAIFVADYGFPGAVLAPAVVLLAIVVSSIVLRSLSGESIVAAMFVTSMLFLTAASVQNDLIGMFSRARSLVGFLLIWMLVVAVGRVLKHYASRAIR
jgi:hypothetical protein